MAIPAWRDVEEWRSRWKGKEETIRGVLDLLGQHESAEVIGKKTNFGTLPVIDDHGRTMHVPDLRGLDLALLPPEERHSDIFTRPLDLSYGRLEGARLVDLNLCDAKLFRTKLQKATLRRTNFKKAILTKAHLEDADLREAVLDEAHLGHIRYTEDGFWRRGTVLMDTHLQKASYVDPLLERCAKDQYYLYVLKYKNRRNPIFRVFFFYGGSPAITVRVPGCRHHGRLGWHWGLRHCTFGLDSAISPLLISSSTFRP